MIDIVAMEQCRNDIYKMAEDVDAVRRKTEIFRSDLHSAWVGPDAERLDYVLDDLRHRLSKISSDLDSVARDSYLNADEIAAEEKVAEERAANSSGVVGSRVTDELSSERTVAAASNNVQYKNAKTSKNQKGKKADSGTDFLQDIWSSFWR